MDIQKRNTALDITRIVAFLSVICVHFFLNTNFYHTDMGSKRMLVMTIMRTAFMVCVPLFIILTGYLMSKKSLSLKYYKGIIRILGIYVLASLACIAYKVIVLNAEMDLLKIISSIFNYTGANYAWYIEMYIGLFMLIPFINLMYNGLSSKREKLVLVATFMVLSSLPSLFNAFGQILPDFWTVLYPITYYFIGAYLREYPIKIRKIPNLLLIFGCVVVFAMICYIDSYGGNFKWTKYNDWYGFTNVIDATLVFIFFQGINTSKFPVWSKKLLAYVSDITLGAYLVSYIFDSMIYSVLNREVRNVLDRIYYFIPTVLVIAVMSLILSALLNLAWKGICVGASKAKSSICRGKAGAVAEAVSIIDKADEKAEKK